MSMLTALLLIAAAQPATDAPLPSAIHNFHDWVVTCDNGLRCEAVSLVPEERPAEVQGQAQAAQQQDPWDKFGIMRLERGPEAGAPLVVTITDFDGVPARLLQYGNAVEGVRFVAAGEGEWRVEPADLQAFLDSLYSEKLVVQDAAGATLTELAVHGAMGAMVYMDERQGRRGTPTALMRKGSRTAAIPAPPPLPVLIAAAPTTERALAISAARLAEVRRSLECEASGLGGQDSADTAALGNGRTLILMSCGAGAYNYNSVPLIAWREGGGIRIEEARLDVAQEEGVDERLRYYVTNAEWDAERRMIHEYAKGRGLGDCGQRSSYVWTGEMFRLAERQEMSECRGTYHYLTTWRAQVR